MVKDVNWTGSVQTAEEKKKEDKKQKNKTEDKI